MGNDQPIQCSFCNRTQDEVKRLVAGQKPEVFICNNCVELCSELLDEEKTSTKSIKSASEAKLLDDIRELRENVRQSINAVMGNRLTASHLISDVETLLDYVGRLEAILSSKEGDS